MQYREELIATVKQMTQEGKGILAADESVGTLKKKFDKINLECTDENRRSYRELLISTKNLGNFISGIILFQETVTQKTKDGVAFIKMLNDQKIVPGIKLDRGLHQLKEGSDEKITNGFDDLEARAKKFYDLGCRFAKWRCVVKINPENHLPTNLSISQTSYTLARYASICQKYGLVPIVEPEILIDGKHSIEICSEVSKKVFKSMFCALDEYDVLLEGCLFKPHMITAGAQSEQKLKSCDIAKMTNYVLRNTCPPNLGGIFFLSGGQSELQATNNLDAINRLSNEMGKVWHISFSFGRALQNTVVSSWNGKDENREQAQKVLMMRAEMNYNATRGAYNPKDESDLFEDKKLYEENYSY